MSLIIAQAEMAQLARDFGPNLDEDVGYLLRNGEPVKQGMSNTKPVRVRIGPIGLRIIYVGNMTVREKQEAGQLASNGDYIVAAPAGTVVFTSDIWEVRGQPWTAGKAFIAGRKASPTNLNTNLFFTAKNRGNTGVAEPNWATANKPGQTLIDGDITWTCNGPADEYQIIQLASPSTYSDMFSLKMACTLRQDVSGKA